MSRRVGRRIARRIALLGLSFFAAVVALEIVVRMFDPYGVSHFRDMQRYVTKYCDVVGPPRIFRQRPNTTMRFRGFSITTNSMGFRGAELAQPKPANEYRILFVGDSVVLGWGARREDLFVTLAEEELNANAPKGRRFRCINSGHNQYDTVQEAALLAELGPKIEPDAVLLVYIYNDTEPTLRVWNELQRLSKLPPPGWFARTWGWTRSVLFQGLNGVAIYMAAAARERTQRGTRDLSAPQIDAEGWRRSSDALGAIRDWCAARKIPFLVLDHTPPGAIPQLDLRLKELGVPHLPFHFTHEEQARPIRHSRADAHANALGHRLLLDKLRPALHALGLATR